MTYQILMIEDDEQICEVVKDYFTRESENEIVVRTAQNGQDGLDLFETERVDLVLLDIMLPGMDGFAICREMRRTSMVPILFLTARSSERDILLGYDLGCDDYIIKPFSLVTLYAKCKALIRRSKDISRTGELVCGRIHMKPSEYRVLVDSQEIELAPKEFALLRMLLENKNKTVARGRLLIGAFITWVYTYKSRYTTSFAVTLAMLPAIVCIVIMMVNGNVGAGVAVAGAFSLVRFRSVPGTAKEIGTIFLAMAAGLIAGMGYLGFAVLFSLIMGAVMFVLNVTGSGVKKAEVREKTLRITIPEDLNYGAAFDDLFEKYLSSCEVVAVKTSNMGSLYKLTYHVTLKDNAEEKTFLDELRCRNGNLEISMMRQEANVNEL